jgi:hypothetical protein
VPTTTALTAVERVSRRLKLSPVSSFTDQHAPTLLDFLNESIHEVLETAEWDFLTRHDGELVVVPKVAYDFGTGLGPFTVNNGSLIVTALGQVDHAQFVGDFRSRLVVTDSASHPRTSFAIASAEHPGASDRYHLETPWPGTSEILRNGFVYVVDYQLPTTVRDVLSVRHEEDEIAIQFVDRTTTFDQLIPSAHLDEQDSPDLVIVGGSVTSTFETASGSATTRLGLMVWPVPTVAYMLSYSYRYLHPDLSAETDVIDAPNPVVDLLIDKAMAKAYRSAVANDPELADRIESDVARRFQRLLLQNSAQPQRRMVLRSHDHATTPPIGSRPTNSRVFYTP